MPLTINVGLSRKASENYQSQGVSINVTAELDQSLLADPRRLQRDIAGLYEQAEIALQHQANGQIGRVGHYKGRAPQDSAGQGNGQPRPATGSQLRALHAIADRLELDLEEECSHEFGCRTKELDVRQASQMIDDLKVRQNGEPERQTDERTPWRRSPMISESTDVAELAKSITDRPYLSWSQCSTYQLCPKKFCFQYVEQAEQEFTPSSLLFGGAIHSVISFHHEAQLEGVETPEVEKLMDLVRDDLEPTGAPIRFNKDEDQDSLLELAERMLTAFLESDHATCHGGLLCIEEAVSGSIDEELPDISGIVDLVTLTDEGLVVTDYKTTRSAWSESKAEENAAQLRLYGQLLKKRFDDEHEIASLQFVTITKAKTPKVVSHVISSSDEKLQATIDQIREVWKGIEAGVFPARPGWICKQCPFQSQCDSAAV